MKTLTLAGIVLLVSGPLMILWIYAVNPLDFSSNIVVPLFDVVIVGLAALGAVSLALSRTSMKPRYATAIGIAFILVPVAIFIAGNFTTETACFGPCGNWAPQAQIRTCSATGASLVCQVSVSNTGAAQRVSATWCSVQIQKSEFPWGNQTGTQGTLGGNQTFPVNASGLLTCTITAVQPPTGNYVYIFLRFSSNVTIGFGPYVWS